MFKNEIKIKHARLNKNKPAIAGKNLATVLGQAIHTHLIKWGFPTELRSVKPTLNFSASIPIDL